MGETGEEARALVDLFARTVEPFGWRLRAAINRNIKYTGDDGEAEETGVDGLFTLLCPYEGRERGVVVDGKRYSATSMGGPARLSAFADGVVDQCVKLRKGEATLAADHGIDARTTFDTAIVAWDCHDGWDREKARGWLRKSTAGRKRAEHPILGLIYTKEHLNRLKAIFEFRKLQWKLEFHYATEHYVSGWSSVLAPESLCSSLVAVRYISKDEHHDGTDDRWREGVLYFHSDPVRNSRFIIPFLRHHGIYGARVTVHAEAAANELDFFRVQIREQLDQERRGGEMEQPRVEVVQLPASEFRS